MKRDLLNKARWDLQNALWNLSQADDVAPSYAAYHVSQSVEKILKVCLKEYGVNYTKTHRIEDLLVLLPEGQSLIAPEYLDWLEDQAVTLYDWESKTRYVEDYIVTRRHVQRVYDGAQRLYTSIVAQLEMLDKAAEQEASSSIVEDASGEMPKVSGVKRLNLS